MDDKLNLIDYDSLFKGKGKKDFSGAFLNPEEYKEILVNHTGKKTSDFKKKISSDTFSALSDREATILASYGLDSDYIALAKVVSFSFNTFAWNYDKELQKNKFLMKRILEEKIMSLALNILLQDNTFGFYKGIGFIGKRKIDIPTMIPWIEARIQEQALKYRETNFISKGYDNEIINNNPFRKNAGFENHNGLGFINEKKIINKFESLETKENFYNYFDNVKDIYAPFILNNTQSITLENIGFKGSDIHNDLSRYLSQSTKTQEELYAMFLNGLDLFISNASKLASFKNLGFTFQRRHIIEVAAFSAFFQNNIDTVHSFVAKLHKLNSSMDVDINLHFNDLIQDDVISEQELDMIIKYKPVLEVMIKTMGMNTISISDLRDMSYLFYYEKSLELFLAMMEKGIVITSGGIKNLRYILDLFDDEEHNNKKIELIEKGCYLASLGFDIDAERLKQFEDIDLSPLENHADSVRELLGVRSENLSNEEMNEFKNEIKSYNLSKLLAKNTSKVSVGNLKSILNLCKLDIFSDFVARCRELYLNLKSFNHNMTYSDLLNILEKVGNKEDFFAFLGNFAVVLSTATKDIIGNYVVSNYFGSYIYELPKRDVYSDTLPLSEDEKYIAKELESNHDAANMKAAFGMLEALGFDIGRDSGVYHSCLRRLENENSWGEQSHCLKLLEISKVEKDGLTEENWLEVLAVYSAMFVEEKFPEDQKELLNKTFADNTNKQLVMTKMEELLDKFLNGGLESLSKAEVLLVEAIHTNGCGPFTYVEGISNFISQMIIVLDSNLTVDRTKNELMKGLKSILNIFKQKGRSHEERNNFFNISSEILGAAPSLYSAYLDLFQSFDSKQLRDFYQNIYPYYHVELLLKEKTFNVDYGKQVQGHDKRDLVQMRRQIVKVQQQLQGNGKLKIKNGKFIEGVLKEETKRIQSSIEKEFQERFGIKKLPEKITAKNMISIRNFTMYLANIYQKDDKKESLLGFFLALVLNGKWDSFRQGEDINPDEYMVGGHVTYLREYIQNRKTYDIIKDLGLEEGQLVAMQEETLSQMVGDVEDIDVRLFSIMSNVQELWDQDLYDKEDAAIMLLLKEYGKSVGKALAMKFQELNGKAKLKEDDEEILTFLEEALNIKTWNEEKVKELQTRLKSLSPITNFIDKIVAMDLEFMVQELNEAKTPSKEITQIFAKIGEELTTESGVRVISNDVQYLRLLLDKFEEKLTKEEKKIANEFLDLVAEHIIGLEKTKERIEILFEALYSQFKETENQSLKERLEEIKPIIEQTTDKTKKIITTKMGTDLDTVITNIRACLGCKQKECNNDTNLSFGNSNKFFLTSYSNSLERSMSDQIVMLLKQEEEFIFMLDNVYGERVPDVLISHIICIAKKLKKINRDKISIFVPHSVANGCHLTENYLNVELAEYLGKEISIENKSELKIEIPHSAGGDYYQEVISNGTRYVGEATSAGFLIKF